MEKVLAALVSYEIEVLSVNGKRISLKGPYEIELESNGICRLLDEGYIIAPFDDLEEMCRFILS